MKEIGAHVSNSPDAGRFGLERALDTARKYEMEVIQVFVGAPQRLQIKQFTQSELESWNNHTFRRNVRAFIHAPYVMNFISVGKSASAAVHFTRECLKSANTLGAESVVVHCGTWGDQSLQEGIKIGRESIARMIDGTSATVLIENTACPTKYKGSLAVIAEMLEPFPKDRVGICFDTCHAFAAGYDLNNLHVVIDINESFGDMIKLIHFNDVTPKVRLGGGLDRHGNISDGKISMGLNYIIRMFDCPFVIERSEDYDDLAIMFEWRQEAEDSAIRGVSKEEWEREFKSGWSKQY